MTINQNYLPVRRPAVFLTMLLGLVSAACSPVSYRSDGVVVRAGDGSRTAVNFVSPSIVHIRAVPAGESFSRRKSLSVIPQEGFGDWSREMQGDSVLVLSTSCLRLEICLRDGLVTFRDADGRLLNAEESRSFTPFSAGGEDAYTVRQTFVPDAGESFYGLGQHQADEWDYNGRDEELYQYNTKISVPFVVSSKGYGILWDSYSFCRWGDPRDYADIGDVFTLYDAEGVEGALTGHYEAADGSVLERREPSLCQEYLVAPGLDRVNGAPDFAFDGSRVSYDGWLEAPESGEYRFLLYYAGYMRLWLDGQELVPEIWRTAWNPNSRKFRAELAQGQRSRLHIEWIPDGNVSYCGLRCLSPRPEEERCGMSWWGEMQDQTDYWFIRGNDADGVVSGYRRLTGKAQIMPKWAMGYWQSRERYTSQEELLSVLRGFRSRHIPLDNIVQDWQYWKDDQWGSHEFDPDRYPDPKGMVDSIHALGARFMISVWPKFYAGTEHFEEMDSRGWMYPVPLRDSVDDWLGYRQSFYDAYDEDARRLFWQQMKDHLYGLGIDAWWMDASEPNIHDCTDMAYRKALCGPTALGPSDRYFNAYALMNARAIYEGQRSVNPDTRVFLLTRNGFAGLQRYSTASWSGDIGTRWEDMKAQISAGLNFSLSGIPYWTQDVGGFSVEKRYMEAQTAGGADLDEWRELQVRWHEWGAYCPIYRSHGQWPFREPWNIAPEGSPAYEAICNSIRDRYSLMPYIYTLASRTWFDDYTIMRAMAMDYGDDPVCRSLGDQFMFGESLLVCPVYEYGSRSRRLYLPEGRWYEIHSGEVFESAGAWFDVPAPYGYCPVFAVAGSVIPHGEPVEYTSAPSSDAVEVYVYAGADGDFVLYGDDGVSYAYERGEFSRIPMHWDDSACRLEIAAREGTYEGMPASRRISVRLYTPDGVILSESVEYDGSPASISFILD